MDDDDGAPPPVRISKTGVQRWRYRRHTAAVHAAWDRDRRHTAAALAAWDRDPRHTAAVHAAWGRRQRSALHRRKNGKWIEHGALQEDADAAALAA
eukprot:gene10534-3184_t